MNLPWCKYEKMNRSVKMIQNTDTGNVLVNLSAFLTDARKVSMLVFYQEWS